MHLLILHGPNLRLLGQREPDVYGTMTLDEINARLLHEAAGLGVSLAIHQSNHEGQLLDWLEEYRELTDGCLINPAGYTHTSVVLLDAVLAYTKPVVEIHLTEPRNREPFRHESLVGRGCAMRFAGEGIESYVQGLKWLVHAVGPPT